ncbi:hypothetical protein LCGC14_1428690 [marine sediment metagenome]|uniref:Peptidase S49 domain-containing protein n=1 Tax=marine sediment metagenome TaxID=412755 RepID=A0A0F9MQZ5_9ZZZZ
MMMNLRGFRRALRGTVGQVMAYQVRDGYGSTLVPLFERVLRGERVRDEELLTELDHRSGGEGTQEELEAQAAALGPLIFPAAGRGGKATALVSVRGVALYDLELQPFAFSTLLLARSINALARDPEVGTIVLDIDSPGGVVTGVPEAADAIWAARRSGKNVVALVNPLAASAAYYLASQADEIVAVPSGETGAIGVFILHAECAGMLEAEGIKATFIFAGEHKTEGNALEPLAPAAREFFQSQVDLIYRQFIKAVARGRGTTQAKVERNFGQGRTFLATEALRLGLVDRIGTVDATLARVGVAGDPRALRLEAVEPAPVEPAPEEPDAIEPAPEEPAPEEPDAIEPVAEEPEVVKFEVSVGFSSKVIEPEPEVAEPKLVTAVYTVPDGGMPVGTKMLFYPGNVPDGWVVQEPNDVVEPVAPRRRSRARRLAILRAG